MYSKSCIIANGKSYENEILNFCCAVPFLSLSSSSYAAVVADGAAMN